jgi:3-hydroxyisobutyrate dehydrogenase-like beta-hydroxyacid dehydrogenase
MAGHLLAAGQDLTVYNRTASKADPLKAQGAKVASLTDLAASCDVIILCVSRTEDVKDCLDQMANAAPNALFIDHSTISPTGATDIHETLAKRGHRFVDAPVTGGSMGAKAGKLTIFLGGSEEDCNQAKSVIAPYTKRAERCGGPGAGQMAKMANQIAIAGSLLGLCECLSFATKAGLDPKQILDVVGSGAAGSWSFENYGPKILARDWSPGFSVANQRKDFGYCKQAADQAHAAIPGTLLVDGLLAKLQEQGHSDWTTAALYEVLMELGA